MSANFVIDEERSWRPPGWIYNHVVSHLAQRFMTHDQPLADLLEGSLGPQNPIFDWRQLSSAQQREAMEELQRLMKKILNSGESVMTDPGFLEQLRSQLRDLVTIVSASQSASQAETLPVS